MKFQNVNCFFFIFYFLNTVLIIFGTVHQYTKKTLNFQTAEVCIINLPLKTLSSKHVLRVKRNPTENGSLHVLLAQKLSLIKKKNLSV